MENWHLALIVIAALLVGVLIPAILQYRSTMKSFERLVENNESEVRRVVGQISELSVRLNRLGGAVEHAAPRVIGILDAVEGITEGVRKVSGSVRTASVVGVALAPAISAAIQALRHESPEKDTRAETDHEIEDRAWVAAAEGEERTS